MSQTLRRKLTGFSDVVAQEVREVRNLVNGNVEDLEQLDTNQKANLVEALNEVLELAKRSVSLEQVDLVVQDYFVLHPDSYTYEQGQPASSWLIIHPLDHQPAVTVTDSAGTIWRGQVSYPAHNQVLIQFNLALAGTAVLT